MSMPDRVVGVWTQWQIPFAWEAEGLTRLLGFLIEGGAERGGVRFAVVVSAAHLPYARAALSKLSAKEGVHWTLHSIEVSNDGEVPGSAMRILLPLLALLSIPAQIVRVLWRMISRPFSGFGFGTIPDQWRFVLRGYARPAETAAELGKRLEKLQFGLGRLGKRLVSWSARQPVADTATADFLSDEGDMRAVLSQLPSTDGWLVLYPEFDGALALSGRRVALLADAQPLDFPLGFADGWKPDGPWTAWMRKSAKVLRAADGVITLSRHVAERHGMGTFCVPAEKLAVIRNAASDLASALPLRPENRARTAITHRAAADELRRFARTQNWTYLIEFPFEEIDYIAVSTAARPSKNVPLVVRAVDKLIRREFRNYKLFTTGAFDPEREHDSLGPVMRETQLGLDFASLYPLPHDIHACFLHAAAVTVHPSLSEGGTFPFQFAESVSVGTPCLFGDGPHVEEALAEYPEIAEWVFDAYDVDALVALIAATIDNREAVLAAQLAVYERMRRRTWADVAGEYVEFVTRGTQPAGGHPHG
jgi:glycosyltransferase involved in cell wall biosynthesis